MAGPGSGEAGATAEGINPPQPRAFNIEGHAPGAALEVTPEIRDQAARFLNGDIPDNPVQASLDGLSRDADMNTAIADVARFIPKGTVKPDDVLRMNAYSLGITPEQVLQTGLGKLPDDEHMLAWNMLINSGARQPVKCARDDVIVVNALRLAGPRRPGAIRALIKPRSDATSRSR